MKKWSILLLAAVLMAGCQSTGNLASAPVQPLLTQVVQPQDTIIAYFDEDWNLVKQPASNGFFRKLYGKTADGHFIAQDFYQENGAKQTDPLEIIDEAGLNDGGDTHLTGPVVWYRKEGSKSMMRMFVNGASEGLAEEYYPGGKRKLRAEKAGPDGTVKATYYYPDGTPMAVLIGKESDPARGQFWHSNGKKALEIADGKDGKPKYTGWDADGRALSDTDTKALALMLQQMLTAIQEYGR